MRRVLRFGLAIAMITVGVLHFAKPDGFVKIVPHPLPALFAVYASGVFEMAGGIGLLIPRTRRAASIGLVMLYLAVLPANINMAVNHLSLGDTPIPDWALWVRLPFQAVFIVWAIYAGREEPDRGRRHDF